MDGIPIYIESHACTMIMMDQMEGREGFWLSPPVWTTL